MLVSACRRPDVMLSPSFSAAERWEGAEIHFSCFSGQSQQLTPPPGPHWRFSEDRSQGFYYCTVSVRASGLSTDVTDNRNITVCSGWPGPSEPDLLRPLKFELLQVAFMHCGFGSINHWQAIRVTPHT